MYVYVFFFFGLLGATWNFCLEVSTSRGSEGGVLAVKSLGSREGRDVAGVFLAKSTRRA